MDAIHGIFQLDGYHYCFKFDEATESRTYYKSASRYFENVAEIPKEEYDAAYAAVFGPTDDFMR